MVKSSEIKARLLGAQKGSSLRKHGAFWKDKAISQENMIRHFYTKGNGTVEIVISEQ